MEKIKSFSVLDKEKPMMDEVDKIQHRERKSFSTITKMALAEFVAHHKEGNDTYTLDMFDTDDFSATPAFFRPPDVWKAWLGKCSEQTYKKMDEQIKVLINLMNDRYEKGWKD